MTKLSVTQLQARQLMRRATGLDHSFPDVATALAHLGFVQIDPINVCGRMQDLILRNRVAGYQENDLMRHLHHAGPRVAFEHHLPNSSNLAAMPLDAWPHLQRTMQARAATDSLWSGQLTPDERKLAKRILSQMKNEGPVSSQDIVSERKTKSHAWDSTTVAKSTLQKLFFHGSLLIAKREGIRRFYHLPERVLPEAVLNASLPPVATTNHWLVMLKLRQRRLVTLRPQELALVQDEVACLTITDADAPRLFCLHADLPLLEAAPLKVPELLIAPLDPIIYDRRITESLWALHYRWEVYTPPHKRVRGYYALPVLASHEFVGHADLKADRTAQRLEVVAKQIRRGHSLKPAVDELAKFLGLLGKTP